MAEPSLLLPPLRPRTVAPRLWRDGRLVEDVWRTILDDEPLPIAGRVLLSLTRWRADQAGVVALGVPLGVRVDVTESLDPGAAAGPRLAVIALPFPKFSDGRSYSASRRLREAGYTGEIRATGDVLLDQLPLMLRAGFDAFEITDAPTLAALGRGELPAISRAYQPNTSAGRGRAVVQSRGRPA